MTPLKLLRRLRRDQKGSFIIETALIMPVLLTFAFGTFEIGSIVARKHQLQAAAAEAETMALAAQQGAVIELATVQGVLAASAGVPLSAVTVTRFFRCADSAVTTDDPNTCKAKTSAETDKVVSSYLRIQVEATYDPLWHEFGLGDTIDLGVDRTVMLS